MSLTIPKEMWEQESFSRLLRIIIKLYSQYKIYVVELYLEDDFNPKSQNYLKLKLKSLKIKLTNMNFNDF